MGPRASLDRCGNLAPPTGIRSPDRPAHSELLYRLSYSGPRLARLVAMENVLVWHEATNGTFGNTYIIGQLSHSILYSVY
jgi:hypothetical protein